MGRPSYSNNAALGFHLILHVHEQSPCMHACKLVIAFTTMFGMGIDVQVSDD